MWENSGEGAHVTQSEPCVAAGWRTVPGPSVHCHEGEVVKILQTALLWSSQALLQGGLSEPGDPPPASGQVA